MNAAVENMPAPRLLRRANIAPLILVNLGVGLHATIWYMATTAMPSAVEELDAAAYLSWATSLYLMTSILGGAMLPPIKSRFGPRSSMMAAGLIVVAGGVLAGLAPNVALILFGRAIQGLGEGFLVALSYTLVRELFDNALVPRVSAFEAMTWAFAVFMGPLLGGWLTDLGTWRLAFFGSGMLPLPMMALGWVILRNHPHVPMAQTAPLLRLSILAIGVMAIAVADRFTSLTSVGVPVRHRHSVLATLYLFLGPEVCRWLVFFIEILGLSNRWLTQNVAFIVTHFDRNPGTDSERFVPPITPTRRHFARILGESERHKRVTWISC